MYLDEYKNIVNIDFSEVCVENMKAKYPQLEGMKCMHLNSMQLSLTISRADDGCNGHEI